MNAILEWQGGARGLMPPAQFRQDTNDLAARERFESPRSTSKLVVEAQDVRQPALATPDHHAPISTGFGAAASRKSPDTRQLFIYRLDGALSLIFVTDCTSDEEALRKAETIASYGYRVEVWSNGVRVRAKNSNAGLIDNGTGRVRP